MSISSEVQDPIADPIEYFLEDQEYHGKSNRTISAYERVLRRFEAHLDGKPEDASRRDCMAWVHSLRAAHEGSTVATYASYVNRFYGYMTQIGVFEANPMTLVTQEMSESIQTNPTRRDLSIEQVTEFVRSIRHPLDRCLIVIMLKTGIRVGELCNLDIRDISLKRLNNQPRGELDGRPESMFVSHRPSVEKEYNGEIRSASNKRKRDTIIPIDRELGSVLVDWLAIRPDPISTADPVFLNPKAKWGHRLEPVEVYRRVTAHASDAGWHRRGGTAAENVTPHYFRHFFTTHLRDRTGDRGVVKYLRGDVADDIIETYTHNWGDRVRSVYLTNIYSCL